MSVIASAEGLVFARVVVCAWLTVSTGWVPKSRDSGLIVTRAGLAGDSSGGLSLSFALAAARNKKAAQTIQASHEWTGRCTGENRLPRIVMNNFFFEEPAQVCRKTIISTSLANS